MTVDTEKRSPRSHNELWALNRRRAYLGGAVVGFVIGFVAGAWLMARVL